MQGRLAGCPRSGFSDLGEQEPRLPVSGLRDESTASYAGGYRTRHNQHNDILKSVENTQIHGANPKTGLKSIMSLNDLEFAYAPVRNQVRDLREYL